VEKLEKLGYIGNEEVKKAMLKVKRELFVPRYLKRVAYEDRPLPIPAGQTISAPHMHAMMLTELRLKKGMKVMEIGAGSGILLAYMKEIVGERGKVIGLEIVKEVYEFAIKNLKESGYYGKVELILKDGKEGYEEEAPYDRIVSSAAARKIPSSWKEQLKDGGILITPVERFGWQELILLEKKGNKYMTEKICPVSFVPLV